MWEKKIASSFFLALLLIVLVDAIVYLLVSFFGCYFEVDNSSARYLLSSISQSLAAIFALVFIVVSVIIAYASKNIISDVLRYIFQKRRGVFVVFVFFFSLLNNFVFLGFIDDSLLSGNNWVKTAILSNIILFILCFIYLVIYVYRSIKVSIAPFYPFLNEVKDSIVQSLISLELFLRGRLNFEILENEKVIGLTAHWITEGMNIVQHDGKAGYIYSYDCSKLRSAFAHLEGSLDQRIYYFYDYGSMIEKDQDIIAYGEADKKVVKKIDKLLSKSLSTQILRPGRNSGVNYLASLFRITADQILNRKVIEEYIERLGDIGELYLENRKRYLGHYDEKLKDFQYSELLDNWFSELYELVKKACIAKRELQEQKKILAEEDKPDVYPQSCLHRVARDAYRFDEIIYFNKSLELIWNYVYFSFSSEETKIPFELLNQLNPVLSSVSSLSVYELKEEMNFNKLKKYRDIIIRKFLIGLKQCPYEEMTKTAYRKHKRLKLYLIENIRDDLIEVNDEKETILHEYLRDTFYSMLGILFALLVYKFSKVQRGCAKNTVIDFIRFASKFKQQMQEADMYHEPLTSIFIEPIMKKALKHIDELYWFVQKTHFDDLVEEPESHLGGEIKSREYCINVFFLILCFSHPPVIISKDYWIPKNKGELRLKFDKFEISVDKANTSINMILNEYFSGDLSKINIAVQSVKSSIENLLDTEDE